VESGERPFAKDAQGERVASQTSAALAGYVLAGGASSRFGADKALAEIGGRAMLARMIELMRSAAVSTKIVALEGRYGGFGVEVVADCWPGQGPLGGIITALLATDNAKLGCNWNFVVSCDMPFLSQEWLAHLAERAQTSAAEVMVARSAQGLEPLCACWRTSAAKKLMDAFEDGIRKVTEAMKSLEMEVLDEAVWKRFDSAGRLFWNMNTQADYEEARRIIEAEGK